MRLAARAKSILDVLSSIAVIVAAGYLVWGLQAKQNSDETATGPAVEEVENLHLPARFVRNHVGEAAVAIVEFLDFQCPFCGNHATHTLPRIKNELVQSGKARYVALHYPIETIHPEALTAALAAECAGQQGRFWEMHDALFADIKRLSRENSVRYAANLGLDRVLFDTCLEDEATQKRVRGDHAEGERLGIGGTPAFFVGIVRPDGSIELLRRLKGAISFDVFAKEVAEIASSGLGAS